MLLTLIKNEFIKIFIRGKTWIVFALFALTIVGMGYVSYKDSENMKKWNSPEYQIENYENEISWLKQDIEDAKNSNDEWAKENITYYEQRIKECEENIKKAKENLKNQDDPEAWRKQLEEEKDSLEKDINDKSIPDNSKTYMKERLEEINIYLDENIEPIESWEFNAINYGISFIRIIGMLILAAGIAVFMSDIVSGESTPPTLKFLLVQPISRAKVILSKFIAVTTTVIFMIGGLEIITVGAIGMFTGFDAAKMPQRIHKLYEWNYNNAATNGGPELTEVANSGLLTNRGMYLLESFGLQILFIVACCAFIFLISVLFKSSMITMAISVMLCVGVTMLSEMSSTIKKISKYIFLTYGDSTSLVDGSIAQYYGSPDITIVFGVMVLVITTVVCYLAAQFVFSKKDILV